MKNGVGSVAVHAMQSGLKYAGLTLNRMTGTAEVRILHTCSESRLRQVCERESVSKRSWDQAACYATPSEKVPTDPPRDSMGPPRERVA